jgi:heme/copper-type cytochrome/quinol oxidase subunit 1/heme/copper-type cytochrome/quinol oxidase subunit 3
LKYLSFCRAVIIKVGVLMHSKHHGAEAHHEHEEPFYRSIRGILTTTNHANIGIMYIAIALINLLLAGISAFFIRMQLAGVDVVDPGRYLAVVTLHGTLMIFFVVMPFFAGIGNYLIPKMVGAPDLYWPKINALGFWMFTSSSILIWLTLLDAENLQIGWTGYAPLSVRLPGFSVDLWALSLFLAGISSILGAVNFFLTVMRLRNPSLKISRLPLFVWSFLGAQLIILYALPPFGMVLAMIFLERNLGLPFFDPRYGGDAILYQHIFWFMGHPEVYVLVLPAMGLVSEILPRMARRPIYGYKAIAVSSIMIVSMSFFVWAHHMFTTGLGLLVLTPFMIATMAVAIPSGIKVFNWIATLYNSRIWLRTPMLYVLGFLAFFIIGGITGVFFPVIPVNIPYQDTYFVLGHFHYVVNAIFMAIAAALFYYFPHMTGKMYSETLGRLSAILYTIGGAITYTAMLSLGYLGMPRRYYQPPPIPGMEFYHQLATAGSIILAIGTLLIYIAIVHGLIWGKPVKNRNDPWAAAKIGQPDFYPTAYTNGSGLLHYSPHPWMSITGIASALPLVGVMFIIKWGDWIVGSLMLAIFIGIVLAWAYSEYFARPKSANGALTGLLDLRPWSSRLGALGHDPMLAVALIIFSEVFLFGTLIASYFYYWFRNPSWPPPGTPHLDTLVPLINTVILLSSGAVMHLGYSYFKRGDIESFRSLAVVTIILGSIFLAGQVVEYVKSGMPPWLNPFAATFYSLTSTHGLHVIMGLIAISLLIVRSYNGTLPTNERGNSVVEAVTIYWHFVDLIWVVLVTILYLLPFGLPVLGA